MEEPAVGFVEAACAVGLGEVGVEAEEDAGDAEGEGVVEDLAEGAAEMASAGLAMWPTMMVSTMPIDIQPSSARMSGRASVSTGRIWLRIDMVFGYLP